MAKQPESATLPLQATAEYRPDKLSLRAAAARKSCRRVAERYKKRTQESAIRFRLRLATVAPMGKVMHPAFKSVVTTMSMLAFAAVIGVTGATSVTCVVGLFHGTGTWCGLPLVWLIGFPIAIIAALVFGLPLAFVFWKFGLRRWWQFGMTGLICALPAWFDLAQPFGSARWLQSGLYDSLNYLGSGFAGGLAYWWIREKVAVRDGGGETAQESIDASR